jgi:DNA-binding response OmpR family regulator
MRILVVDDSTVMTKILDLVLTRQGFDVTVAYGGNEALACLQAQADIGLVITDIMMPDMDGIELLRRIKESIEYRGLPVIMLTALSDSASVREAAHLGCRHYLVKPVEPSALLARIREVMAGEPPVLRNATETMQRLDLDHAGLTQVTAVYMRLIESQIAHLETMAANQASAAPPIRPAELQWRQIEEGAELLGANRLLALLRGALSSSVSRERLLPAERQLLTRELQALHLALCKGRAAGPVAERSTNLEAPILSHPDLPISSSNGHAQKGNGHNGNGNGNGHNGNGNGNGHNDKKAS